MSRKRRLILSTACNTTCILILPRTRLDRFVLYFCGNLIHSQCLLQYTIAHKESDEVRFDIAAHGNSKRDDKPFYHTEKSIIEVMKENVSTKAPAVAFSQASTAVSGMSGALEPGDLPRSRKQRYDLKNKIKKPG